MNRTISIAIGGAAGQGVATPGNIFARIFVRRGLHLNAYNAYQSIIRGGHTLLTIRTGVDRVTNLGDKLDLLIALNQDTMDRHLRLMGPGTSVIYNADTIQPEGAGDGVQLCPLPVKKLTNNSRNKLAQNTIALGAALNMMGVGFQPLDDSLTAQFKRKGDAVVKENVDVSRAGYDHASENFKPFEDPLPMAENPKAMLTGNMALAMGGVAAGVKFYCAYPMSPATGVLHWMATHARQAGIMVRQAEDEIGVINMAIGAAHTGVRAMCATSGGGFALMTEALGMSAMMETPVVVINVQRGGPSTGIPTKTEQGDLWQMLGAGHGDYPKIIAAPTTVSDCFKLVPEVFNLTDQFQCPGIILGDLLLSEGTSSVDPEELDFRVEIDRGELITSSTGPNGYKRYALTQSGVSPRAVPGVPHHIHTASTDEHAEDGTLISDEFTDPTKRREMMDKRQRKVQGIEAAVEPPELIGEPGADVTLVGWGSTEGVLQEAVEMLSEEGISANRLQIRWLVPLHGDAIVDILQPEKHTIIVENNYSGQFARYLRSETSYVPDGHIRKYDGEPFMPHHIIDSVKEQLAGETTLSVPMHEIKV